jgi:diguanylate cyclase (GGDEF)-like protein
MLNLTPPRDVTERLCSLRALNILNSVLQERLDRLTRLAARAFNIPIVLISLIEKDRQWLKSSHGLKGKINVPNDVSFCGHAILQQGVFEVQDALNDPRFHNNPLLNSPAGLRFYAGQPIYSPSGHAIGTICLIDTRPRAMNDDDNALLKDLALMVECEISTLQLSTTDTLTGLPNRRGFMALAEHAHSCCKRTNQESTMLFFDLDKFKAINDMFGHGAGDDALKNFADALRKTFRVSDVMGRLGGDEFVVFLSDANKENTQVALARLRCEMVSSNENNLDYNIEYSVGIAAVHPDSNITARALLKAADADMYNDKKKNNGKA